jgi:hypothetical protein
VPNQDLPNQGASEIVERVLHEFAAERRAKANAKR